MNKDLLYREERLFLAVTEAAKQMRLLAEQHLAVLGVTLSEYNLMRIVENTPHVTARDAQKRLHAEAPSVSNIVQILEKKKILVRKQNKNDRRVWHMRLTAKGEKIVKEMKRQLARHINQLSVTNDELGKITTGLEKFNKELAGELKKLLL